MDLNENKKIMRVRATNWSEEKKTLLKNLIKEKIEIIENKDASTNVHYKKKAAWQEVFKSFNSLNSQKRSLKQLVNQWRNTKNNIKKRDYAYTRARLDTGGGPPPPSPPPEDIAIIELIPNEFEIDSNCFDSDGIFKKVSETEAYVAPAEGVIQSSEPAAETQHVPSVMLCSSQPSASGLNKTNLRKTKRKIGNDDYEKQVFLLVKCAKEKEMAYAAEQHRMRMEIMELEKAYWEKKLNE